MPGDSAAPGTAESNASCAAGGGEYLAVAVRAAEVNGPTHRKGAQPMLPKSCPLLTTVIKIANGIARDYDQEYVGTEHLLLAIAREGTNLGAQVLSARGVSEHKLRGEVDRLVKKRLEETWVFGRLPGTPHFKNVMAEAIKQCQHLQCKEVRSEHLLLALAKEQGSVAQKALTSLKVSFEDVRQALLAHAQANTQP